MSEQSDNKMMNEKKEEQKMNGTIATTMIDLNTIDIPQQTRDALTQAREQSVSTLAQIDAEVQASIAQAGPSITLEKALERDLRVHVEDTIRKPVVCVGHAPTAEQFEADSRRRSSASLSSNQGFSLLK